jgi:hypothetical protein
MRGKDEQQLDVFSYISPEQRVPQDHPLRWLRAMTDEALQQLQPRFNKMYAKIGRPSIDPVLPSRVGRRSNGKKHSHCYYCGKPILRISSA